jgi:hypothetical protein
MTADHSDATDAPTSSASAAIDRAAIDAAVRDCRRRSASVHDAPAYEAAAMVEEAAPVPAAARVAEAPGHPVKVGAMRVDDRRVFVHGKSQVMAVFANPDGNYSVKGYGDRSQKAFGAFFLGMDAGAEYDRQSRDINAAIESITAEEGFALGRDGARAALQALNGGAGGGGSFLGRLIGLFRSAPKAPARPVHDVSTLMLAEVTKALFGIPDGDLIVTGPPGFHPHAPSLCPGDFAPVSGFLFRPDPGDGLAFAGPALGKLLAAQVGTLVARLRAAGTPPPGRLTRVLFDTIPPEEDDRLVRTLIGTMMGLLPTIDGNLIEIMNGLRESGEIPALKAEIAALGANPGYDRVRGALKPAVFAAMQKKPVPEEVWRVAAHDHVISGDNPVAVKKGDMVVLSIESATRADLAAGTADVSAVFGGMRKGKGRRPTHGCPGYAMAMGIIFGAVAVILNETD